MPPSPPADAADLAPPSPLTVGDWRPGEALGRLDLDALVGKLARDGDIKRVRRVFVNRNLRMDEIEAVGFDMDYTLAIYNQPRIETLSVTCTLDKLVHQRGYPDDTLVRPMGPTRTVGPGDNALRIDDPLVYGPMIAAIDEPTAELDASLLILPVRKQKTHAASMITLGRTANNDVVVADISVSKFHAYFRIDDGGQVELTDARSRNGTYVAKRRLQPQVPTVIASGEELCFGRKAFHFLSAAELWKRLRAERLF